MTENNGEKIKTDQGRKDSEVRNVASGKMQGLGLKERGMTPHTLCVLIEGYVQIIWPSHVRGPHRHHFGVHGQLPASFILQPESSFWCAFIEIWVTFNTTEPVGRDSANCLYLWMPSSHSPSWKGAFENTRLGCRDQGHQPSFYDSVAVMILFSPSKLLLQSGIMEEEAYSVGKLLVLSSGAGSSERRTLPSFPGAFGAK